MRVPLDECLPRKLKFELVGHEAKTVPEMGRASKKNSALLSLSAEHFDVFLTVDKNIAYQQNLKRFKIAIVALVVNSNRLVDLRPLVPNVRDVFKTIHPAGLCRLAYNRLKQPARLVTPGPAAAYSDRSAYRRR